LASPGAALPTGEPGAAAGLNTAPTLAALLRALRHRWLLATGLAVLGAAAAVAAVWLVMPPRYPAEARLLVDSRGKHGFLIRNEDETDFNLFKNNQAALLTGPVLLSQALNREEVRGLDTVRNRVNPVAWLEQALKVDFLLGPGIMRVSLSGDRPEELATILNAVVDTYVAEMAAKENAKRGALLAALKRNQEDEEQKLRHGNRPSAPWS
jgi:uncharacterized protein involved in exopolysaccharide biosynthesis